jgi:hypothetical protein
MIMFELFGYGNRSKENRLREISTGFPSRFQGPMQG